MTKTLGAGTDRPDADPPPKGKASAGQVLCMSCRAPMEFGLDRCPTCKEHTRGRILCPGCGEDGAGDLDECVLCGRSFRAPDAAAPTRESAGKDPRRFDAFAEIEELEERFEPASAGRLSTSGDSKVPVERQTNGRRDSGISAARATRRRRSPTGRRRLLVLPVILAIVTVLGGATFALLESARPPPLKIDGQFREWERVQEFPFSLSGATIEGDMVGGSIVLAGQTTHLRVRFSTAPSTTTGPRVVALVDIDGAAATGYRTRSIGADLLATWAGAGSGGGTLYRYTNASGTGWDWEDAGGVSSAGSGREVEAAFMLPLVPTSPSSPSVFLSTIGPSGPLDEADYPFTPLPSVVTLAQRKLLDLVPSMPAELAEVALEVHGAPIKVEEVLLAVSPPEVSYEVAGLPVAPVSGPVSLTIRAVAGSPVSGALLTAEVTGARVAGTAATFVTGVPTSAYSVVAPPQIKIDGAFADWKGIDTRTPDPLLRGGLDVTEVAQNRSGAIVRGLLGTRDALLHGIGVPLLHVAPSGGGGGGGGPPLPLHEDPDDHAVVEMRFVDGQQFRIHAVGREGRVRTAGLEKFASGAWVASGAASAAADGRRIEVEATLPASVSGLAANVSVWVFGWNDPGEGPLPAGAMDRVPLPGARAAPRYIYTPIRSDVTSSSFTISWVADQAIDGSVEFCLASAGCTSAALGGNTTILDSESLLPSGAALVRATFLDPGSVYYYKAISRNGGGQSVSFPSAPPYPSVVTKTTSAPGEFGNPIIRVRPYRDVDSNYVYSPGVDVQLSYFLVYLNHSAHGVHGTGSVTMVARGATIFADIDTKNIRTDDPTGNNHMLSTGDTVSLFIAGLHNDGTGLAYWKNETATYTLTGAPSPIDLDRRVEKVIPEFGDGAIAGAIAAAPLALFIGLGHRFRSSARPSVR